MKATIIRYVLLALALGLKLPIVLIGVYWVVVGLLIEILVLSGGEGVQVFFLILIFPILSGFILTIPNRLLLRLPILVVVYSFVLLISIILIWSPLIQKEVIDYLPEHTLYYSRIWLSIPFICALSSALMFAGAKRHLG